MGLRASAEATQGPMVHHAHRFFGRHLQPVREPPFTSEQKCFIDVLQEMRGRPTSAYSTIGMCGQHALSLPSKAGIPGVTLLRIVLV